MKKTVHFHQIQKQILEITCAKESLSFQITQQASNLLKSRLFKLTQKIIEELGTDATFVRIEQLELDLGNVRLDNWENEVVFRYEQALRKELKKIIENHHVFSPQQTQSVKTTGTSLIELLDFYLKKGYLAWWCESSWKNEMGIATPFSFKKLLIHLGQKQRKSLADWLNTHLENQTITARLDAQINTNDLREIIFTLLPAHVAQEVIKVQQDLRTVIAQSFTHVLPLLRNLRINLLQSVLEKEKNSYYFKESTWLIILIQKSLTPQEQTVFWEKLAQIQIKKNSSLRTRLFNTEEFLSKSLSQQQQAYSLQTQWKNAQDWEVLTPWLKPKSSAFFWKTLFPTQHITIKEVTTLFSNLDWQMTALKPITNRLPNSVSLQIQAYLLAILWENKPNTFKKEDLMGLLLEEISLTLTDIQQRDFFVQIEAKAPNYRTLIKEKSKQVSPLMAQRSLEDWKVYLRQQGLNKEVLQPFNLTHADFILRYLTAIAQLNPETEPAEIWANALMILQNQPRLALELFIQRHFNTILHPIPAELAAQLIIKLPSLSGFKITDAAQPEKNTTLSNLFDQPEPSPETLLSWLLGGKDLPLAVQLRIIFSEKEKERVSLEATLMDWIAQKTQQFEALVLKLGVEKIDFSNVSLSFFSDSFRKSLFQKIQDLFPALNKKLPDYRLNNKLFNNFFETQSELQVIFALIHQPSFDIKKIEGYLNDSKLSLAQKKILENLLQKTSPLSKATLQQTALKALQEELLEILPAKVEKLVALLNLYLKNDAILLGTKSYLPQLDANTHLLMEASLQNAVITYFERKFPKEFYFWVEALSSTLREKVAKINPPLLEKTLKQIAQNQQKAHLEKIKKALSQNNLRSKIIEALNEVYVQNIGLVLLHPFLSRLFARLDYLENRAFKSLETAERGVHLLHYIAYKKEQPEEYELSLNKLLCGLPLETPIRKDLTLSTEEKEMAESLLVGVIQNWAILKNTSPDGLRGSFLVREGKMSEYESHWQIQVVSRGVDVLLGQLPWGLSTFKLNWMEKIFQIDWQTPQ